MRGSFRKGGIGNPKENVIFLWRVFLLKLFAVKFTKCDSNSSPR